MSGKFAKAHLFVGVAGFLVFVLTGQYMAHYHDGLSGMETGQRILMRTTHVFIMLTSLINICVGVYARQGNTNWLQCMVSAIFLVSPFLMTLEFFYGSEHADIRRPFAYGTLILLFAAGTLLVVDSLFRKSPK